MKVKEESEKAGLKLNIQKIKIMASGPITLWQTEGGKVEAVIDLIFLGSKIIVNGDCSHAIKRHLLLRRKSMTNLDIKKHIKKQRHHFADKGPYSQSYGFPSSHIWMWELDHEEGWVPENWCFQTLVLQETLESPLGGQEIKPVNSKENQPWIFIGRTDVKLKLQYFSHLMRRTNSLEKTLMLGKIEGRRKRRWQREMVGWHHWLNGHEFELSLGDGEEEGSLPCWCPWGHKELDMT